MRMIFLMVDTLRYDHLGAAGNPNGYTPELDKLAEHSFFFENYYISSFPTVPNREDTMCGTYSFPDHGWGPLPADAVPIAQILNDKKYICQLITDTPHLIGRGHGYHRGFHAYHWLRGNECDTYLTRLNHEFKQTMPYEKTRMDESYFGHPLVDLHCWINAERAWEEESFVAETAKTVSKWIEDNSKVKDVFLWVDDFECHEPWVPPQYYLDRLDPSYKGFPVAYPNYGPSSVYTRAELRNMQMRYAGEVCLTSKWMGHILRKLQDVGIYDDSLIVFQADHGTYLGDRGRTGKFHLDRKTRKIVPWPQYDEINHIPLMIKLPAQKKGKRIREIVQPVDLLPTILDLAGQKVALDFHGHSLKPLLQGRKAKWPRKYAYSTFSIRAEEPNFWTTITTKGWSMNVGGYQSDDPELFDRKKDPGQKRNIVKSNKQTAGRMLKDYITFLESVDTDADKVAFYEPVVRRMG
ncbi:MAG: sulfatase-like hydrolase/transferase [Planctomycetota bacterium]